MVFPYSVHWMLCLQEALPQNVPAQVLIATSKKKFHHAVDRNRVKRLTRECYRQHKPELYQFLQSNNASIVLSVNYIHNAILDYDTLYRKFDKLTANLLQDIARQLPPQNDDTPCKP